MQCCENKENKQKTIEQRDGDGHDRQVDEFQTIYVYVYDLNIYFMSVW